MTALDDLRARLRPFRSSIGLGVDGQPKLLEYGAAPPSELVAEARRCKPALLVELLREKARDLLDFVDGEAPYEQRISTMPEYQETTERLAEAQERLFQSFRAAGFAIMWSPLVEEFIIVGDSDRPPGTEGFAVYTWAEVEVLKDAAPERVVAAHKVKRAIAGTVKHCVA